jgi:transcriptional regulator with XRE-family HTH domain
VQIVAAALLTIREADRGVGAILTRQVALQGSADLGGTSPFGPSEIPTPSPESTLNVEISNNNSTFEDLQPSPLSSYCVQIMTLGAGDSFRARLALLRKAKNLTQQELEKRIGKLETEGGYISRIETGGIETPPFEVMDQIAHELDVEAVELFFSEGLDENADQLRKSISRVLASQDAAQLRKIYRLILVSLEKYSK